MGDHAREHGARGIEMPSRKGKYLLSAHREPVTVDLVRIDFEERARVRNRSFGGTLKAVGTVRSVVVREPACGAAIMHHHEPVLVLDGPRNEVVVVPDRSQMF